MIYKGNIKEVFQLPLVGHHFQEHLAPNKSGVNKRGSTSRAWRSKMPMWNKQIIGNLPVSVDVSGLLQCYHRLSVHLILYTNFGGNCSQRDYHPTVKIKKRTCPDGSWGQESQGYRNTQNQRSSLPLPSHKLSIDTSWDIISRSMSKAWILSLIIKKNNKENTIRFRENEMSFLVKSTPRPRFKRFFFWLRSSRVGGLQLGKAVSSRRIKLVAAQIVITCLECKRRYCTNIQYNDRSI